ncbi:hypothetical protein ATCC90586_001768 [Pythium insidiosum]|nr:hypothetical protein ATCC90586_001768 [Pythium insidiosum]
MFSARKAPDHAAAANVKRASPLWSMFGPDGALDGDVAVDPRRGPFSPSSHAHLQQAMQPKRQRLEGDSNRHVKTPLLASQTHQARSGPVHRAPSLGDIENDDVLVETPDCTVTRVRSVPGYLIDELRRGEHVRTGEVVANCRIAVPSQRHASGERRVVLSYYVLMLRERLVLWQEDNANVVSLPLPEELHGDCRLFPFLFALYGSRVSLMVVAASGLVLFWEDIHLPYESVPLSVQIPLQLNEEVATHNNASLIIAAISKLGSTLLDSYARFTTTSTAESPDDLSKEADITKQLVLNALVYGACNYEFRHTLPQSSDIIDTWQLKRKQDDLFTICVKMAEEYVYFEAMVYLAFREDEANLRNVDYVLGRIEKSSAAKRLEVYARKFPNFTDFLLRWGSIL